MAAEPRSAVCVQLFVKEIISQVPETAGETAEARFYWGVACCGHGDSVMPPELELNNTGGETDTDLSVSEHF